MAYENITLRKRNMTMVDGYFYTVDHDQDALIVKTDDGTQSYSYPLDNALGNQIVSLEHDGRNFWMLENPSGDNIYISRWNVENYVLQRRDRFEFNTGGGSYSWDSNAFTVEHYHLRFYTDVSAPTDTFQMYVPKTKQANLDLTSKLQSGMTISLGPNVNGRVEDLIVNSVSVSVAGATQTIYQVVTTTDCAYDYDGPTASGSDDYRERYGDPACFYNKLWIFNNKNGTSSSSGNLYSTSAYSAMTSISGNPGGEYQSVQSCTFYDVPNYIFDREWQLTPYDPGPPPTGFNSTNWPKFNSIIYVRTTNLIFLNPDDFENSYGSMTMDNLDDDQATVLTIYDLSIEGVNVYRLQLQATYYGTTYTFSGGFYSYQLSTLEPFITSISLRANPAILPANGVNVSTITAIVKDQFDLPIVGKNVYFTEDDPVGSITGGNPKVTDSAGEAITTYTAGTSAREVKITATAEQGGVETPID